MNRLRWLPVILMLVILPGILSAQTRRSALADSLRSQFFDKEAGMLSLGARNNMNIFFLDGQEPGIGSGASLRLQLLDRLSTEWFADVITGNIHNKANRMDAHIGWNVMFYLIDPKGFTRKLTPFIAAGHCFDYTGIKINGENQKRVQKWTSAVQMSLGCHYNITPKFDISLTTLYDLHLGRELEAEIQKDGSVAIAEHKNAGWEGHIMFIISAHYKLCQLWKPRR